MKDAVPVALRFDGLSPPVRGALIEIPPTWPIMASIMSPPVRGAWIEIALVTSGAGGFLSPPVWGRGLKCPIKALSALGADVAPP